MNNQEILDNAPERATHVDNDIFYKAEDNGEGRLFWEMWNKDNKEWWWCDDSFVSDFNIIRSLADIKRIAELEEEKLNMQIFITSVMESVGRISVFVENIEPSIHEAVIAFNRCMEICDAIDEINLPEFEIKGGAE